MIRPEDVTACLVTRGDIDMGPILESLIFPHVIVWDNSERENLRTAGRYAAIQEAMATHDVVYVQDDDVIVTPDQQRQLLDNYRPGRLTANQDDHHHSPQFDGLVFVGWGAIFDRDLPAEAFKKAGVDEVMPDGRRTRDDLGFQMVGCDILFSMLTPRMSLNLGQNHRPEAFGPDRAHRHRRHHEWKQRYYAKARDVTG